MSKSAVLRICGCCSWIWKKTDPEDTDCPKCGFASYGAFWVYGHKVYKYAKTQELWISYKVDKYLLKLYKEIEEKK